MIHIHVPNSKKNIFSQLNISAYIYIFCKKFTSAIKQTNTVFRLVCTTYWCVLVGTEMCDVNGSRNI